MFEMGVRLVELEGLAQLVEALDEEREEVRLLGGGGHLARLRRRPLAALAEQLEERADGGGARRVLEELEHDHVERLEQVLRVVRAEVAQVLVDETLEQLDDERANLRLINLEGRRADGVHEEVHRPLRHAQPARIRERVTQPRAQRGAEGRAEAHSRARRRLGESADGLDDCLVARIERAEGLDRARAPARRREWSRRRGARHERAPGEGLFAHPVEWRRPLRRGGALWCGGTLWCSGGGGRRPAVQRGGALREVLGESERRYEGPRRRRRAAAAARRAGCSSGHASAGMLLLVGAHAARVGEAVRSEIRRSSRIGCCGAVDGGARSVRPLERWPLMERNKHPVVSGGGGGGGGGGGWNGV